MKSATHYCVLAFRFGEVEKLREVGADKARVRWANGHEQVVPLSSLRPLVSEPESPGKIVRAFSTERLDTGKRAAMPKDPPVRSAAYRKWLRTLPCACCGTRPPSEVSHHPEEGHGSMAEKCCDLRAIPLSTECHREHHQGRNRFTSDRYWIERRINEYVRRYLRDVLHVGAKA